MPRLGKFQKHKLLLELHCAMVPQSFSVAQAHVPAFPIVGSAPWQAPEAPVGQSELVLHDMVPAVTPSHISSSALFVILKRRSLLPVQAEVAVFGTFEVPITDETPLESVCAI